MHWILLNLTILLNILNRNLKSSSLNFKEKDKAFKFTRHVSTETYVVFRLLMYKALEVEFISRKSAYHASNNGMYIKRVTIKRIVLDLNDAIVYSKLALSFFYLKLETLRGVI